MKLTKSITITLKETFPLFFTIMVFSPVIVGCFIDLELVDPRNVIINLVWIPLFTIPYIITKRKIFFYSGVFMFGVFGLIEIAHWIIMKGPITLTSLLVASNTNYQEASEFLDLKGGWSILILIPFLFLIFLCIRYVIKHKQNKVNSVVFIFIILFTVVFIMENALNNRLIRKGVPHLVKVSTSFIMEMELYKEAKLKTVPTKVEAFRSFQNRNQTFVLIIGESASRRHMSLYGGGNRTNPKLEKRNDLIKFTNIISPYSNTLQSVLSMLSLSNIEDENKEKGAIDLIDIFHSSGFKTYWLSNQSPIGIWDNLVTVLANKSDEVIFINTTSNSSFEATMTTSYDERLFKPFQDILSTGQTNKFIVIHLMGNHSAYHKRYPSAFNVFSGDNKREKTIAQYDNSMLYNDYVLDSLFNLVKFYNQMDEDKLSSVIYLSDHGENIYDEFEGTGHTYTKVLPNANVEIPFLLWLSPNFINKHGEKGLIPMEYIERPYMIDDLFHSIIDLNGINSPLLDQQRSLFHSSFNLERKRILEDGRNYDLGYNQ